VGQVVQDVPQNDGLQHPKTEIQGEFQPGFLLSLFYAIVLLKKDDAESPEARTFQCQTILGVIHCEAAGTTASGREKHILIFDFLPREPSRFEIHQVLEKTARCEVGWVALAVVAVFLADMKCIDIRRWKNLATVTATVEDRLDKPFMSSGQAANQDGCPVSLRGRKRPSIVSPVLYWSLLGGIQLCTHRFFCQFKVIVRSEVTNSVLPSAYDDPPQLGYERGTNPS